MIFKHELRNDRKMVLIWVCCIAGMNFIMLLMFPGLQSSMKEMAKLYSDMGSFGVAFGMDQLNIATPEGFYGSYIGAVLSLGGAMFAAMLGAALLSKEEAGHTAEFLYTLPYSRSKIVLQKIGGAVILLLLFEVICYLAGILGLQAIGADYSFVNVTVYHVGQTLMHLEIAAVCILISACTKRTNVGIGLGIALLLYFMDMMSRILEQLKFCKYITPFYYANAAQVMKEGSLDAKLLIIGMVVMVAAVGCSLYVSNRKDLAA